MQASPSSDADQQSPNVLAITQSSEKFQQIRLEEVDELPSTEAIQLSAQQPTATNELSEHSFLPIQLDIHLTSPETVKRTAALNPANTRSLLRGIMRPGVNAIMGPTGSGKSSLLDILAGRKDMSGLSGQVLINGKPLPSNFKQISGYVVQQDVVLGTLSVRENLWFSASLRLPTSISSAVKKERIEEILYDLGLNGCADTKVGNELIRGISGGEKKRACIAMELITSPSVLFLDEPTTGLDASTANAVILLLKKLGKRGRNIILSIHQPRYSIYRLFDTLTLLSLGRLAYHGSYDDVLPYFDSLGYHCQEHNNPADFFLDVINGDSTALAASIEENDAAGDGLVELEEGTNTSLAEQLAEKFQNSQIYSVNRQELAKIEKEVSFKKSKGLSSNTYATSFCHQFGVLSNRAFKNFIRNPFASIGNLVLNIVIAVVFGLLFYQVDDSPTTGTQNRFGILFFICTNLLFTSISAVEIFNKEKDIFKHEYVSGYYMVISYFLSKLFADLIPMRTIPPVVFGSITYWMVGLKPEVGSFFIFVVFLIVTCYASTSIALFYSASFENFAVANIFISLTFVFSILFAGLLLNLDTVLPWLAWIKYLSIAQYGFSGLSVNEFRNQEFASCFPSGAAGLAACLSFGSSGNITSAGNLTCSNRVIATKFECFVLVYCSVICSITGEGFVMERLGIGSDGVLTDWDLWRNVVALACIAIGMMTLTYIQLTRTKTTT